MEPKVDRALRWPIGIVIGIIAIIALSVGTVVVAVKNPVQEANDYNKEYRVVDKNINAIIESNIAFQKKYRLEYVNQAFVQDGCAIKLILASKDGTAIKTPEFEAILTRPDETKSDQKLELTKYENSIASFKAVNLPKEGRWNLFVNATVNGEKGFLKLKLDTREPTMALDFSEYLTTF